MEKTHHFWDYCISAWKRLNICPCHSSCKNINLKWIKDVSTKPKSWKPLQERVENTLEHTGIGYDFLSITPVAQNLRQMIDKWHYMKLKSTAAQKKWSRDCRSSPQNEGKSLSIIHLTKQNPTEQWTDTKLIKERNVKQVPLWEGHYWEGMVNKEGIGGWLWLIYFLYMY
jgi:hypothetical protein